MLSHGENVKGKGMKTKITALLLAALMLLSLMVSCNGKKNDDETKPATDGSKAPSGSVTSGQPSVTDGVTDVTDGSDSDTPDVSGNETDTAPVTDSLNPNLEPIDGNQEEIVILGRKNDGSYLFAYDEVLTEGINADRVNNAVFKRNAEIEEKYKVIITAVTESTSNIVKKLEAEFGNNGDTYDIVMPMIDRAFVLATKGILTEMSTIPYVNLSKPYWMQYITESVSINDYSFFAVGDTDISAFNTVGVTFFNKELLKTYGEDISLYDDVMDNKWTLDRMIELCTMATQDSDGVAGMGVEDTYGITANSFCWQPFFYATGNTMVSNDESGKLMLTVNQNGKSEGIYNYLTKVVTFMNDTNSAILVNRFPELEDGGWGKSSINMFMNDRALFWVEIIYGLAEIRSMKSDYGILPMPKADSSQTDYISYIHSSHASATAVPIMNKNLELTGRIIEDMAYTSYLYVRPEFYEIKITTQNTRDEDSYKMLNEYIYEHIIIDMAQVMSQSGLNIDDAMRNMMTNGKINFSSLFAAQGTGYQKTVDQLAQKITDYGKRDTGN